MIPMDTPNLIVSSERGGPDNGSRNLLLCWTGGMIDECLLPGIFERMSVSRSATNRLFAVLYELVHVNVCIWILDIPYDDDYVPWILKLE